MHPQIKIIGELADGSLKAVRLNNDGSLVSFGTELLSVAKSTSFINTTTTGTIAAEASSIAIANSGSVAGTVKGAILPAGASISWSANGNDTLDSVNYNATGTTFLITTVV